jgi:Domain of unknown function (DUF5753)
VQSDRLVTGRRLTGIRVRECQACLAHSRATVRTCPRAHGTADGKAPVPDGSGEAVERSLQEASGTQLSVMAWRVYELLFVPGLLQTEDYARAAMQRGLPTATKDEIQRLVEARMSRRAVLARETPLRLWTIVDEGALHRPVGRKSVMATQLDYLAESGAELAHVTLQVIPHDLGGHGAFAILQFGEAAAADVVYIERQGSGLFLENQNDVNRFIAIFEHLRALALPPESSTALLRRIARDMREGAEA